jgi:biotin-dependent carboxylase-like uncharacterized protein
MAAMTPDPTLEVLDGGILTTIQDLGRPGFGALGVPRGGACDQTALAVANLLVGNRPDAPVLEATIVGPELLALRDIVIGLAGADLGAVTGPAGRRLPTGAVHRLAAGERIAFPGGAVGRDGEADQGCRAYLAVPGGFSVDLVLDSASTALVGAFGGFDGRSLRAGDRLAVAGPRLDDERSAHRRWPAELRLPHPAEDVAILAGPEASTEAGRAALVTLTTTTWRVSPDSDRRGLRLEGPGLELDVPADGPSHGVPTGTIQVTPSGLPLVLLPDAGPTGGYPVLAVVASASLSIVGQARPGGSIRFRLAGVDEARALERERRHLLAVGAARLGRSDPWDDLSDLAGA